MLKKMFLGVLFAVLVSGLLIAGINFSVTKAMGYSSSGTTVGGIIWENTTWTLENSPYIITDTVQIPENVTLTIEPGVTVISNLGWRVNMFLLQGIIYAHGTPDSIITFDCGGDSNFIVVASKTGNTFADLDYCIIKNGTFFFGGGYAHLNMTHCEVVNMYENGGYLHPEKDTFIEYNLFKNCGGFQISTGGTHDSKYCKGSVYIRYNLFIGRSDYIQDAYTITSLGNYDPDNCNLIVEYNSFLNNSKVLKLMPEFDKASMSAPNNYWGTTDTSIIDSMIYDKNDDIRCAGFIEYLPILTEPHPDTPILLEDINVDINGIFRHDDDGKWRCYTNMTIKNNSYRNVTLSWIYLKATNITYTDETFEELNISGNETLNYVIEPEHELSLSWTMPEFGFTKEPKILWVLFKTPISEAYETITLTAVIPEFPPFLILPILMVLSIFAGILRRKPVPKHQNSNPFVCTKKVSF